MTGLAHGVRLVPLLAASTLRAALAQELQAVDGQARWLSAISSMQSSFTADDSNSEVGASTDSDSKTSLDSQASQIVSGIMETFLHENELEPGEMECLVNGSSQFAAQVTAVSSHAAALLQSVTKTKSSSSSSLLGSSHQQSSVNDQAGDISSMVDSINDGEDMPQDTSGSSDAPDSSGSEADPAPSAEQELGLFFGSDRRLEGLNAAAMAMSATFVGMQLGGTMQQMVTLAHEVVKKCVHADALAAFQLAGVHMRSLQYMEGRFRANGKEIAVELANATKAYEDHNPHEFGRNVGKALRKVLLSSSNGTQLPEGPPNTTAMANMSAGLIEGFFGPGAALDVKSDDYPMPVHIDMHQCMSENVKFFQQVWAETMFLFAQEDLDGNAINNMSGAQKKAQFGTTVAFSMMQLPSALKQCNLGSDEQDVLEDAIKAMGKGTSFKFTWPDGSIDKDEVANKMADSVKAWSELDYHTIGTKLGRLLQEFAVKAYPQKYAMDGDLLRQLRPNLKGSRTRRRSALMAWVAPGLAASLLAGLLALRMVRQRRAPGDEDGGRVWDPEDQPSGMGAE